MNSIKSLITSIDKKALHEMESKIEKFISKWRSDALLMEVAEPTGMGVPDDILAIDYVIYEDLEHLFFEDRATFLNTGAALLGKFLVSNTGFSWNQLQINSGKTTICLEHSECSVIVPIQEMVFFKYSGRPQFETFEALFFDILFSGDAVEYTYPLINANLLILPDCKTFKERYGYEIPEDILELYTLYSLPDEEFLIRQIGLKAYNYCIQQSWDMLRACISSNNHVYNEYYGKDWQKRYRRQNENLFEKKT